MHIKSHITRKNAYKIIKWQLVLLSIALNFHLAHMVYNVRCAGVSGQVVAYFTTKQQCEDMAQDYVDARIYRTNQDIAANAAIPDIAQ